MSDIETNVVITYADRNTPETTNKLPLYVFISIQLNAYCKRDFTWALEITIGCYLFLFLRSSVKTII